MKYVIISIPHLLPPVVWVAENETDVINTAKFVVDFYYYKYTLDDAATNGFIKSGEKLINTGYGNINEILKLEHAPSEFEAAKKALFHYPYSGHVLTMGEAKEFIANRNNPVEVRIKVEEVLSLKADTLTYY